jgi:uncharacterized cupin superfamily protein
MSLEPAGCGWRFTTRSLTDVEIANVFTIACDAEMEHEGFRIQQAGIGKRVGAELLAGNVYEVDPGKKLWPYHLHHANEEWLVVLRGRPTLRTPEGERGLIEGDVACFVRGGAGAHQVRNATEEPVRIMMLSTRIAPEIMEYPDSDKVLAKDAKDDDIFTTRYGEPVDYWEGES